MKMPGITLRYCREDGGYTSSCFETSAKFITENAWLMARLANASFVDRKTAAQKCFNQEINRSLPLSKHQTFVYPMTMSLASRGSVVHMIRARLVPADSSR